MNEEASVSSTERGTRRFRPGPVTLAWLAISAVVLLCALPRIDLLGLYYDEAFVAQQARDFTMPERQVQHPDSVRTGELFGRPFPIRNAAYLGSLKSHLLIPAFEAFGSSVRVLRTTTLVYALVALLFCMWATQRLFDVPTAMLTGLLLASDPSFYFFSQYEWGPFTTNLLCRCLGLLLVLVAWRTRSRGQAVMLAAAAGATLGLGIFSRADFGVILAAAGVALLATRRDLVTESLRLRGPQLAAGAVALLLAALPMFGSALSLLTMSAEMAERGDVAYRWSVLVHALDGSQFLRVMTTGGLFREVSDQVVTGTPFPIFVLCGAAIVLADARRRTARGAASRDDSRAWVLLTLMLVTLAMLFLPGAVRAHHQLNGLPLTHMLVACAGVTLFRWEVAGVRARAALRSATVIAGIVLIAANLHVIVRTSAKISQSGGKGRWTSAIGPVARALDATPGAFGVSFDWGFHEPLLFLTQHARLGEAIWSIPQTLRSGRPWIHVGTSETLYLVHDAPYDLFGLGPDFLDAIRRLDPSEVEIETHRDGEGDTAFYTVRIKRPHRIVHTGRFVID